jgi:hypothetical protein
MYYVNAEAIDLDPLHRRVRAPRAVIDVSAHGMDRRQRAEPRKYVRTANIPGMDDGIAVGKCRERLRPQQTMSIGNRANGSHRAINRRRSC